MTTLNEQFERYHGDQFVEWLNAKSGSAFAFERRGDPAPDLLYSSPDARLGIEITGAYYDKEHAKFLWAGARDADEAEDGWVGVNPDVGLKNEVLKRISKKSAKDYGEECILLVVIPPGVTSYADLSNLLSGCEFGQLHFSGVYVAGKFPNINFDPSTGGYRVLPLKEWEGARARTGS